MNTSDHQNKLPDTNASPAFSGVFAEAEVALVALESANVGIWIMDTVTRQFLPSKRAKQLLGYAPDQNISFDEALTQVAEKHRKRVLSAVEHAINSRTSLYVECPVLINGDTQRWLSITGGYGSETKESYFSGIMIDITDQKQGEMRRSKFIGMVSHELKTPLTALKAYVQLLSNWAKKQKDNFTIGALSKVEKQVKKMLNMINGLLSLSGAEAGKIHLTKQEFEMGALIDEVIEETLFLTSSHDIVKVPCDPIVVTADRDKIEQVLVNLLSNAAKYSAKDLSIKITCTLRDKTLEVAIKDQGMGISPENISQLFQPHYRVESAETEKIAGFGIGLYLCSEIIKRHNGKIWVESDPGNGSTFKFTLPL